MFEGLRDRLGGIFRNIRSRGVLGEKETDAALREIRLALLEADVNFRVVKDFIAGVRSESMRKWSDVRVDTRASRCRTTQAPIRDPLVTSISYASGTTQSEEVSVVRATAISRSSSRSVCDAVGAGRHGVWVRSI